MAGAIDLESEVLVTDSGSPVVAATALGLVVLAVPRLRTRKTTPGAVNRREPAVRQPRVDETELSTIRSDLALLYAASRRVAAEFASMNFEFQDVTCAAVTSASSLTRLADPNHDPARGPSGLCSVAAGSAWQASTEG